MKNEDSPVFLYFHGYASSGQSNTAKLIKEAYPEAKVICPTYNTKNAHEAVDTVEKQIRENVNITDNVIFVGTSLGGFFANYFSNKYGVPAVLVNPCLDPQKALQKYNPEGKVDCESFLQYYTEDRLDVPKTVVLGKKDDVIPYNTYEDRVRKYHVFIKENMKHRVSEISEIKEAIDEIVNNSYL